MFTNPILDFELSEALSESAIPSADIRNYVQKLQNDLHIAHISVYVRDLNNGPWIGINEKEYFSPASMLKTPLIIALYKWYESDETVLQKKVLLGSEYFAGALPQQHAPSSQLQPGMKYSLGELSERMIQYSDNVATAALYDVIPK